MNFSDKSTIPGIHACHSQPTVVGGAAAVNMEQLDLLSVPQSIRATSPCHLEWKTMLKIPTLHHSNPDLALILRTP
jgi:hypothetical protein